MLYHLSQNSRETCSFKRRHRDEVISLLFLRNQGKLVILESVRKKYLNEPKKIMRKLSSCETNTTLIEVNESNKILQTNFLESYKTFSDEQRLS